MDTNVLSSLDEQIAYLFRGTALKGETREHMEGELRERLKLGRPLRVKLGLDPTKPFLHIGHLAPLLALKRFADIGHRTYLLLGGFTAMIGDPAGRRERRKPLSEAEVATNIEIYKREIFRVLDPDKTIVVNNATWFGETRLIDFLFEAARVTLAKMLEHEDFGDRFDAKKPIGLQELVYPIAQAYDSMVICAAAPGRENDPTAYHSALGSSEACCDVEVGGNDQLFNFTLARDLMVVHHLLPEVFITTPLIQGRDGKKMGKSEGDGNVVRFTDPSPKIFNEIMALDDEFILPCMASLTTIADAELHRIEQGIRSGELGRHEAKQQLATNVVKLIHGKESARLAEEEYEARRYGRIEPERDFVIPSELAIGTVLVTELVFAAGLAKSKSDARRLVEGGGIWIDGRRASAGEIVEARDGMILQLGQRRDARAVRLRKNV